MSVSDTNTTLLVNLLCLRLHSTSCLLCGHGQETNVHVRRDCSAAAVFGGSQGCNFNLTF
ncbi:hypothetical protein ERO13_A03G007433v2 [Gossypium hirsutum]|nr:hypothetical protein ERO13_A03G007433v2 [Gossypium hirsutum]